MLHGAQWSDNSRIIEVNNFRYKWRVSIIFFYSKGEDWQWTITLPLMYWTLRSGNILETLTREAHLSHLISSDLISLLRFVSLLTPQPLRLTDFVAGLKLVAWKICRFFRLSLIRKKNPLNKTLEPKNSKIPAKFICYAMELKRTVDSD